MSSDLDERQVACRVPDPDDPRAWRVRLQQSAPLHAGIELLTRIDEDLTAGMSAKDQAKLIALIGEMHARLGHDEEAS